MNSYKKAKRNRETIRQDATDFFGLRDLIPLSSGKGGDVFEGFQGHRPIVLKVGDINQEAAALKAFQGCGVIPVLGQMENALLMERARPGVPLRGDNDAKIAALHIKKLHQAPLKDGFPFIDNWLHALEYSWDIPQLKMARTQRDKLLETSPPPVLLHGDLHHANILQQGNDWVVIDPKGVVGDPAYEIGAFLRNPLPEILSADFKSVTLERIHIFSSVLNMDPNRIKQWCFVQAVLAWVWALEDKDDPDPYIKLTNFFEAMER